VSLICGIGVGLAPWLQIRVADLSARLKESSRGSEGPRSQRLRSGLVVAEVALAVVLLVGASLMIQSIRRVAASDPGFDPESLLTVHISVPNAATPRPPGAPARLAVTGRELLDRIGAVPGVAAVALGNDVPLDGNVGANSYTAEGQGTFTAQNRPRAYVIACRRGSSRRWVFHSCAVAHFSTARSRPRLPAVIVSERVASRFWPGEDPIGKRVRLGADSNNPWLSIVGVVEEVRYRRVTGERDRDPDIYLPFADRNAQIALAIRTTVPPASVMAPVREAIRAASASIAVYDVASMGERVRRQSALSRFITWVMGVFAGIGAVALCARHLRRDVLRRHAADARDRHPPCARRPSARSAGEDRVQRRSPRRGGCCHRQSCGVRSAAGCVGTVLRRAAHGSCRGHRPRVVRARRPCGMRRALVCARRG
jgi:hypothetical protein